MKRIQLGAMSLGLVLGMFVVGCGEDEATQAQTTPVRQEAAVDAAVLAPQLRLIAADVGDAEEHGPIKALSLKETAMKNEVQLPVAVEATLNDLLAAYDARANALLKKLANSGVSDAEVNALTAEKAILEQHSYAIEAYVKSLEIKKEAAVVVPMEFTFEDTEISKELSRRWLLARTYEFDEDEAPRALRTALAARSDLSDLSAKLAALDERVLVLRRDVRAYASGGAAGYAATIKALQADFDALIAEAAGPLANPPAVAAPADAAAPAEAAPAEKPADEPAEGTAVPATEQPKQ